MGKQHYYTFKILTPSIDPQKDPLDFQMEVHKWDTFNDELPLETYKVAPYNRTAVGGCSCPAWKWDCKHVKCCIELCTDYYKRAEPWNWLWTEKNGWVELFDLEPSQVMREVINKVGRNQYDD